MLGGFAKMVNIYDLVDKAKADMRVAKVDAELAREDSKADPKNRKLRIAAENAAYAAAEAGRKVAELEFMARIIEFDSRDEPLDELLVNLAPCVGGQPDFEWVAAATLARSGVKPPANWRSSVSGEPIHDFNNGDSRRAVAA